MFHFWLSKLDTDGCSLRIVLLDFSKAFDRINLNVLITKLIDMGLRRSLIPWLCDFLSNRRQRVKLEDSISEWAQVNAGVPQGTKLGPILFLVMVNDLTTLQSDRWKYVDDLTISEVIPKHSQSNMQHELDYISNFKELRVNFQRALPDLAQLTIDGTPLETISSYKLLGLQIQNDLKWNEHVDIITKKAAKRLYIIRTLKRSGVPDDDLITDQIYWYTHLLSVLFWITVALCGIHAFPPSLLRRLNVSRSDFSELYFRTYLTVKL